MDQTDQYTASNADSDTDIVSSAADSSGASSSASEPVVARPESVVRAPRWIRDLIAVLVFLVVALLYHSFFALSVVRGESMEPTLHDGQVVLVGKGSLLFGPIQRGDIVVFHYDGENLIKRVAALPGDVAPDGRRLLPGTIYVLGDNAPVSDDSRQFGPIPVETVIGKLLY